MRRVLYSLAVVLCAGSASAATLYQEDFTGQTNMGLGDGSIAVTAPWSLDAGASTFATDDFAKVTSLSGTVTGNDGGSPYSFSYALDDAFVVHDNDAFSNPLVWTSPTISIAGFVNISLSFDWWAITTNNDAKFEVNGPGANDLFRVGWSVDGGTATTMTLLTSAIPTFASENFVLPMGNDLEIYFYAANDASDEFLALDNIQVTGQIPVPATGLLLLGGLGALALRARRKAA